MRQASGIRQTRSPKAMQRALERLCHLLAPMLDGLTLLPWQRAPGGKLLCPAWQSRHWKMPMAAVAGEPSKGSESTKSRVGNPDLRTKNTRRCSGCHNGPQREREMGFLPASVCWRRWIASPLHNIRVTHKESNASRAGHAELTPTPGHAFASGLWLVSGSLEPTRRARRTCGTSRHPALPGHTQSLSDQTLRIGALCLH